MKILMIHSVNTNEEANPNPYSFWTFAITNGLSSANYKEAIDTHGAIYNDIFDKHIDNMLVYGAAVRELMTSGPSQLEITPQLVVVPNQLDPNFFNEIRWTAGMVAQWVVEDGLRSDCRDRLCEVINQFKPDVICSHSLGTLLCYDLFANDPRGKTIFVNGTLITFGTQIGNPFVKDRMWGGQVKIIQVKQWYNLYNPNDSVFVAPIDVAAPNFHQFTTVFGNELLDLSAHDVTQGSGHSGYLDNPTTNANIWPALVGGNMAMLIARNIKI